MGITFSLEEALSLLTYGVDVLVKPGRHLAGAPDQYWLHHYGWYRCARYMEAQQLVDRKRQAGEWVYKLTEDGRARIRTARDPALMWRRKWDGLWRQIVFDLPITTSHDRTRRALLRWLRRQGFGYLQDSVWIRPDPVGEITAEIEEYRENAAAFTILECRCAPGFSNAALVQAAWPFVRIKRGYETYEAFANRALKRLRREQLPPSERFQLFRRERQRWQQILAIDPLLPKTLWPADYPGPRACQKRQQLLHRLVRQITQGRHT